MMRAWLVQLMETDADHAPDGGELAGCRPDADDHGSRSAQSTLASLLKSFNTIYDNVFNHHMGHITKMGHFSPPIFEIPTNHNGFTTTTQNSLKRG